MSGVSMEEIASENEVQISEEEEGSSLTYIPEKDRTVLIERIQYSVYELYRRYKRGDIILKPFYQREVVWKNPKKSKLIESVLLNIPIPSIYLAEEEDGRLEVVDGKQRLHAFFEYIEIKNKLNGLSILSNLNNVYFNELEPVYQRKLEDYMLHIFIIKKGSHPDIRFDIFERINEGATQLNAQELRNSMYREGQIAFLKRLSKNPSFLTLTKGKLQSNRLKDQEAVLRFLSFYVKGYEKYQGNLNSFLNETLSEFDTYIEEEVVYEHFNYTMKTICTIFGEDAFVKEGNKGRKINMSLFDVISYSIAVSDQVKLLNNKQLVKEAFNQLLAQDPDFNRAITANTLTKKNVEYRFSTWMNRLDNLLKEGEMVV